MKKSFILLGLVLLALVSCKDDDKITPNTRQAFGIVFSIPSDAWVASNDSTVYTASFDVPELNDAIYDHGAVIVYVSFNAGSYDALPEVYNGISYIPYHSKGSVSIEYHAIDGSKLSPLSGTASAKIVLIAADKIALHPDVNLQDYNEVKRVFHLK